MNQTKIDKLFLRLAKDTLQLYHAATGKGKFCLANKMALIGVVLEGGIFLIMSISLALIGFYLISFFFLCGVLMAFFNFYETRGEYRDLERLEGYAKESGTMIQPSIYNSLQRQGRYSTIISLIFMAISPFDLYTALFFGIFLRGLSYYVAVLKDLPPGKNIFEKIKNKIKSINLAPAILKPVKVNGK